MAQKAMVVVQLELVMVEWPPYLQHNMVGTN